MMKLHRVAEQRRGCLSTSFISKDKSLLSQKYYAVLSKRSQGDLWTKKMKKGTVELTPLEKRSHCLSLRNHIVFEEKFTCTFWAFHFLFLKFMQVIGWVYINIHRQTETDFFLQLLSFKPLSVCVCYCYQQTTLSGIFVARCFTQNKMAFHVLYKDTSVSLSTVRRKGTYM